MAESIEIRGLEERIKQFGEASTKNPVMRKRINEVIREMLRTVQKALQGQAQAGLDMKSDPRKAYKAVRMAVYKQIFGGQVNILSSRKAGNLRLYEPPRKGTSDPLGRGGNRVRRTASTTTMMSYQGVDRGFILRFLNDGTNKRNIVSMGGRDLRTKKRGGNRGRITSRNWFGEASHTQLENAAANLDRMIDDIIKGVLY